MAVSGACPGSQAGESSFRSLVAQVWSDPFQTTSLLQLGAHARLAEKFAHDAPDAEALNPKCVDWWLSHWTSAQANAFLSSLCVFSVLCVCLFLFSWTSRRQRNIREKKDDELSHEACSHSPPRDSPNFAADAGTSACTSQEASRMQMRVQSRILCIEGMRTIAIVIVILYHEIPFVHVPGWFKCGRFVMQFFFALSGFVLCYGGTDQEVVSLKPGGSTRFIAMRTARLLPLYYVTLVYNFVRAAAVGPVAFLPTAPTSALMLQSLFPLRLCSGVWLQFGIIGAGWFVSALALISCFFPLLVRVMNWRCSCWTLLSMILLCVFVRSVPTALQTHLPHWQHSYIDFYAFAPLRVPEFFAGMLTGRLFHRVPPAVVSWSGWGYVFDGGLVSIVAWLSFLTVVTERGEGLGFGDFLLTGPFCIIFLSAACAASAGSEGRPRNGIIGLLLASTPLTMCSEYSYGAFLAQDALLRTLPVFKWQATTFTPTHVIGSFLASAVLLRPIEKAAIRASYRLAK